MTDLRKLLDKAGRSSLYMKLLNLGLGRMIPFNGPHRFRITKVEDSGLEITLPYIRKNMNHIRGMHACALATLCEYISGLSLARTLPANQFRIILKSIHMDYHYQAKMDVMSFFGISADEAKGIAGELEINDSTLRTYSVRVYDKEKNHICTGDITWQIKPWAKVRAKV